MDHQRHWNELVNGILYGYDEDAIATFAKALQDHLETGGDMPDITSEQLAAMLSYVAQKAGDDGTS